MAIIELEPNQYTRGDGGTFEEGTVNEFGYLSGGTFNLAKSAEQVFSGSSSLKSTFILDNSGGQFQAFLMEDGIFKDPYLYAGKSYILKAAVFIPDNGIGTDGSKIILTGRLGGNGEDFTTILRSDLTISPGNRNSWKTVSFYFTSLISGDFNFNFLLGVGSSWGSNGSVNVGGVIYIDRIELFQVIDEDALSIDTVFGRNPVPIDYSTVGTTQMTTGIKYEISLYLRSLTEDKFSKIISEKGFPALQDGSSFTWDMQRVLLSFLSPDLPAFNQASISHASTCIRRFYTAIKEYQSTPFVKNEFKKFILTDVTDVLHGGLNFIDWPGNTFFADNVANKGQFLSWAPDLKRVAPDQQEYLYFMTHKQGYQTLYLHCKIYYTDGTTHTFSPFNKPGATNKICIVPVGHSQLGLGNITPGKTVRKYSVWVNKSSNPANTDKKSEERTYVLDWDYHKYARYFLFQNSLGAMETLRCLGKFESGIDVNSQEGIRILSAHYSAADSQNFNYNTTYQVNQKGNTGFISTVWKQHCIEFMISDHRYEMIKGKFIKIRLLKDKADILKDYEYMNSLTFDYTYAHQNAAYSNY